MCLLEQQRFIQLNPEAAAGACWDGSQVPQVHAGTAVRRVTPLNLIQQDLQMNVLMVEVIFIC